MSARLIIALWLSSPVAIALVLCALNRARLSGESTDKLRDEYADQLGIGGGEILNHVERN